MQQRQLLADLVALHYKRNNMDFARGSFRVRGDTVEIFPAHLEDRAWRVSMFGDEIETISEFDPLTGEKTNEFDSVKIFANSHYVTPKPTLNQAVKGIQDERRRLARSAHDWAVAHDADWTAAEFAALRRSCIAATTPPLRRWPTGCRSSGPERGDQRRTGGRLDGQRDDSIAQPRARSRKHTDTPCARCSSASG